MYSTDGYDSNYTNDYINDTWDDYVCGYDSNNDYIITKPNYYKEQQLGFTQDYEYSYYNDHMNGYVYGDKNNDNSN